MPVAMKHALCRGLMMCCVSTWARAASSVDCADFTGVWEVYRQPAPFWDERVILTQLGCDVTIYDNDTEGTSMYAHYHAKGNVLECDKELNVTDGIEGPGVYCDETFVDLNTHYVEDDDGYASWPAKLTYHQTPNDPWVPFGEPSLTGSGPYEGMGLRRLYKVFSCPNPSTSCYRHWAGAWKDSLRNFTLTQEGCNVIRKYWEFWGSPYEMAENYTACGDSLVGVATSTDFDGHLIIPDGPFVLSDQNHARDAQCSSMDGCTLLWSRRAPDPPKPVLPTCLPQGGHPIAFADAMKPPCCDNHSILVPTGVGTVHTYHNIWDSYASWEMCGSCLPDGELCNDHPGGCCEGLTCVSSGPMYGSYCMVKRGNEQSEVIVFA